MIATSGFLGALECTKFVFHWGSTMDCTAGAYSVPPGPLAGLSGDPTSKGKGSGGERREKGRDGRGGGERAAEGKGEGTAPLRQIPGSAPENK